MFKNFLAMRRYRKIFDGALGMGQSVDGAFKHALDQAVADKTFADKVAAIEALGSAFTKGLDREKTAALEKAKARYKKL